LVHNTFDIFYSYIGDNVCSCVIMQKLFGMNVPLTHLALQIGKNHLFFHDSFLNVLLTSEVITEALPDHRVRVKTTYGVGAPKLLLPIVFALLRPLLTRNFHSLMEGDAPMRNRRGELRRWGLNLPKTSYSFTETLDLRAQNVFPGADVNIPDPVAIPLASMPSDAPVMFGRSDHYGLQIFRRGDVVEVFPRLCPHEGACLDKNSLNGEKSISCGWHGRRFGPFVRFLLSTPSDEYVSLFHHISIVEGELRIKAIRAKHRKD
jgi:hypothetical protein